MKVAYVLTALGASLLVTSSASAAKTTFTVDMSPDQENVSPDLGESQPEGTLTATFDDTTKRLCGKFEYKGLTGAATGILIHRAPANDPTADSTVKIELPPVASPASFNVVLNDDFIAALNAEETELYGNIQTAKNPSGELRTFTPWDVGGTEVPCGPESPTSDAGAPADAGASSSSSSSSGATSSSSGEASSSSGSTGDDDDDSKSSSGSTTGGKDAGAAKKKDDGGCSTTGDTSGLSFAVVLGVGIAALARGRRKKR
ncbi:MAG: CHRD domain-containing protein [Labilithrix sp.]